jgi:HK97 family phage portal protein
MIISNLVGGAPPVPAQARPESNRYPRVWSGYTKTRSGQRVTEDAAKKIATAYRCANTICNDLAQMPLQVFNRYRGNITRIYPNRMERNTAYLVERKPNRWMEAFLWKRTAFNWLIWWGNTYIWSPPSAYRELFILDSSKTFPVFDQDGNKWYQTDFPNGQTELIPDVEMVHLMLNSKDGLSGMSVLEYARETMGRQLAAHETQDEISGNGLKPTAALWVKAPNLDQEAKEIIRKSYLEAAETGAAIFEESKFSKFETITMKPTDAQFLEGVAVTDADIANFFDFPLHKLNMGKQSYESNEQQELAYVKSTLNPYCVQLEQAGGEKWIAEVDQPFQYLKFNRDALLQTDTKTRTEVLIKKVAGGILTPNQALQIEDMNGYEGGDNHYLPSNLGRVLPDGKIEMGKAVEKTGEENNNE